MKILPKVKYGEIGPRFWMRISLMTYLPNILCVDFLSSLSHMSLGDGTVIVGHVGIALEEDIDAIGVKIHFMNVLQEF